LWRRLGFDELFALFALVANRACDPRSKLAATRWVEQFVPVPGLPKTA
jgi:hypothetical protein